MCVVKNDIPIDTSTKKTVIKTYTQCAYLWHKWHTCLNRQPNPFFFQPSFLLHTQQCLFSLLRLLLMYSRPDESPTALLSAPGLASEAPESNWLLDLQDMDGVYSHIM